MDHLKKSMENLGIFICVLGVSFVIILTLGMIPFLIGLIVNFVTFSLNLDPVSIRDIKGYQTAVSLLTFMGGIYVTYKIWPTIKYARMMLSIYLFFMTVGLLDSILYSSLHFMFRYPIIIMIYLWTRKPIQEKVAGHFDKRYTPIKPPSTKL